MAQPWEKYAAPAPAGPWQKYSGGAASTETSPPMQEDQPVLPRALHNLPSSLLHFGQSVMPFGRGDNPPLDEHGDWRVTGPFEDIGHVLGSLLNIPLHPEESFAQDPVGTVAYPLMMLHGGIQGITHPTTRSIGSGMIDQVKTEAPQIHKWGKAGGVAGAVLGGDPTALLHEGGTGYAAGAGLRALPALARGAREGYRNRPSAFETVAPSEQSGMPTVGRFDVNQYGPAPSRVPPVEVGGGHVPDYKPPSTVDLSSPSSMIPPVQPSAPAAGSEVVTGLHLPEVPRHYAGEPNPTAAFKNDQAIVAELRKVPGITQDSLTPDMVHEVRKALGQRRLKESDIERRVGHIRHMLPK